MLDTLAASVSDPDERVATFAISLLCQHPTGTVVERLQRYYQTGAKGLSEARKLRIIDALARSNDPSCVAFLSRLARRRRFLFFDLPKDAIVRKAARAALHRHRLKVSEQQAAEEHERAV
jgi:hypothetical protein